MSQRADSAGPTGAMVFGCIFAGSLMVFSFIQCICELIKPDNQVSNPPAPGPIPNPDTAFSPRLDRFFGLIPGRTEEEFQKSSFLVLYDQTEPYPSNYTVINALLGLKGIYNTTHPVLASIQSENEEYNMIKAYTSNETFGKKQFYAYVNNELCRDNRTTLKKLMPFIRRATRQINNNGPYQSCVVYRGMRLDQNQREYFTEGKVFRFPGFTSATSINSIAQAFGSTMFEIHISAGCRQVRDVASVSCFPCEQEWLFSPYSRFKVIQKIYNKIILQSLDNIEHV